MKVHIHVGGRGVSLIFKKQCQGSSISNLASEVNTSCPTGSTVTSQTCANVIIHETTHLQFSMALAQNLCGYTDLHLAVVLSLTALYLSSLPPLRLPKMSLQK